MSRCRILMALSCLKFVNAVQQLGLEKAVPKKILDYMNIEGLTRENVASHLQKYRLYLKKIEEGQQQNMAPDSSYFHMAQLDGLRQLSSSSLLTKFHPSVYSSLNLQGSNASSFSQLNSSSSANPFGTYHRPLLTCSQNVTQFPLDPLQFPRTKCSSYMGDFKGIGNRAIGSNFLDSRMSFGSSSTSLPSASTNNLMLQENFTQPLHKASDGNQSCLEGALSNSVSPNISVDGLSRFPSHNWQGNLRTTTRFPSNSLPLNHVFSQDQVTSAGNGLVDYSTSTVSAENPVRLMQCEPPLLGDFMQNMNTLNGQKWEEQNGTMLNNAFGNVNYPLPADNNMVFRDNNATRSKGLDDSLMMRPTEDNTPTTLNIREYVGNLTMMDPEMKLGNPENALADDHHYIFDDIMNDMLKQASKNALCVV